MYLLNNAVSRELDALGLKVYRRFVGNYMTSIDMLGGSVSILKLDETLKTYMDAPSNAPGFHVDGHVPTVPYTPLIGAENLPIPETMRCDAGWNVISGGKVTLHNIIAMVKLMSDCII